MYSDANIFKSSVNDALEVLNGAARPSNPDYCHGFVDADTRPTP